VQRRGTSADLSPQRGGTYASFFRIAARSSTDPLEDTCAHHRRKAILIARARERLTFVRQRLASDDELRASLTMDLARSAPRRARRVISIEDLDGGHREPSDEGSTPPELPHYESDPHLRSLLAERATLVTDAVARLTAAEQETMRLYYGRDLTMREVAAANGDLGIARVAVAAQGIVRLRALLRRACGGGLPATDAARVSPIRLPVMRSRAARTRPAY